MPGQPALRVPVGIVFDLDGTLVDTTYIHTLAWWQAFQLAGHVVPMASLHRAVGMGPDQLMPHVLGDGRDERRDEDLVKAHDVLFATWHERVEELPGACHLLSWCHHQGVTLALASSTGGRDLEAMLGVLEHPDLDVVVTSEDVEQSRPSPDLVQLAIERMGLRPKEVLVVGDTVWDVEAARTVGARSVGLECGGTSEAELRAAGATWVFRDPESLCQELAEVAGPGREAWPA
jgi:HAD superfamily hydrolase (TIGR01509 family)